MMTSDKRLEIPQADQICNMLDSIVCAVCVGGWVWVWVCTERPFCCGTVVPGRIGDLNYHSALGVECMATGSPCPITHKSCNTQLRHPGPAKSHGETSSKAKNGRNNPNKPRPAKGQGRMTESAAPL
jgi:hypothetical protein